MARFGANATTEDGTKKEVSDEFEVDYRDDHAQPAIIGRVESVKESVLKKADDARIPKKRFAERQALKHKDQQHLENLFNLPAQLKDSRDIRQEREQALRNEIQTLKKQQNDEEKLSEEDRLLSQVQKKKKIEGEVRDLKGEDEERVKEILLLPKAFENLRASGPERAKDAVENELKKLTKQQKEEEEKRKEKSASPTTSVQSSEKFHPVSTHEILVASRWLLHLRIALCVLFFLMALFPDFRLSIQEVIINRFIGCMTPAVLREVSTIGGMFKETLPLTSKIIQSLYKIFGFWVSTAGVVWLYFQLREIVRFIGISTTALIQNTKNGKKG